MNPLEKLDQWWQTTGLNLCHRDACTEAFKLGMSVVAEDHRLALAIERRREVNPGAETAPFRVCLSKLPCSFLKRLVVQKAPI